jgi:two-component system nitrogen regulation sensor histidine kinase NtrY
VKKRIDLILLSLGIIFLFTGFIRLFVVDQKSENQFQNLVQNNVTQAISKAREEQKEVFELLQKNASYGDFALDKNFPYYIYKGDSLVFWSNSKFIPDPSPRLNKEGEELIEYNKNLGLLVRSPFSTNNGKYEVISNIWLYEHSIDPTISSGFDYGIFRNVAAGIKSLPVAGTYQILDKEDNPLFYVLPVDQPSTFKFEATPFTRTIFSIGLILLTIFSGLKIYRLHNENRFISCAVWLIGTAVGLRLFLHWLDLPWALLPETWVPRYLLVPPGFGDMIISGFILTIVLALFALWQLEVITYSSIRRMKSWVRSVASVGMILLTVLVCYLCYVDIQRIYDNPTIGLNYSLKLTSVKLGTYIFLFMLYGVFFLGCHLLINFYTRLQPKIKLGFLHWLYGTLLSGMLFFYFGIKLWIWVIPCLYILWAYVLRLPRYFYILRFKTFIYFLSGAFAFTFMLFILVKYQDDTTNAQEREKFAKKLLQQKDLKAEILLNQFNNMIQNDSNLANTFEQSIFVYESLKHRIKDSLLSPYFDVYQVQLQAFTTGGKPIGNDTSLNLSKTYGKYASSANKTEFTNLFYHKGEPHKYILFSEISKKNIVRGVLMLEISYFTSDLKKTAEKIPENSFFTPSGMTSYSYALYDKNHQLIYKEGDFDYTKDLPPSTLAFGEEHSQNIGERVYQHYIFRDKEGNTAVLTHPTDFYREVLSGFSYLFLIALLGTVVLLTLLGILSGFRMYKMSFSSKIQFFLNLAFLVPLTIIILLTLGVVIASFISLQNRSLQENSQNVANTVNLHYQNYMQGKSSRAFLEEQLSNLALSSDFEVCLFDTKGKIHFTSMAPIYLTYQLSDRINPQAYIRIMLEKNRLVLIEDHLGSRKFKSVYIPGKTPNGKVYGIIGVVYPHADKSLQRQIKEVVAAILIIFLGMFFILLVLSYTASTNLTAPLKFIASKLKKTNLNAKNEEIFWKSNDEIGLLTNEYNRMIKKLEESREALSTSEKQTAWREMAKQVAHEIKNPLTPMKLSIQQLQRTLPADNDETRKKIDRALESINEQIDNISDIANSFSEFAKMPVPRTEIFDLVSAVEKTVDLYSQNNQIYVQFETSASEILVQGDKMILTRAVTNLIINGMQSVPPTRKPVIKVWVSEKEEMGMVEVKDNGVGIAEDVRKKVFIPNFSTKLGGSGLGLSMAKRGVEHAGGNIWFETVEGEGTSFFLELPKPKPTE